MNTPSLEVVIGTLRMSNPVMVASGTFGYGQEYAATIDVRRLGAIVVKGIRLGPWDGNPLPRMVEVPGGLLNAIGLQGPGVEGFVREYLPFLRTTGVPTVVNIWGTSVEEYAEVAARFEDVEGIDGLEVNVSCPNVKEGGASFGADPRRVAEVVAAVRRRSTRTLLVKLAPNVPGIRPFAVAAEDAGADALSICNTLPGMVIDIETRRPVLANRVGGLSGPALHPVAVKLVWDAAQATRLPIIGMGGIMEPADAIEFLIAGATAVAVGTANFVDPTTSLRVIEGIERHLREQGLDDVRDLIGSVVL